MSDDPNSKIPNTEVPPNPEAPHDPETDYTPVYPFMASHVEDLVKRDFFEFVAAAGRACEQAILRYLAEGTLSKMFFSDAEFSPYCLIYRSLSDFLKERFGFTVDYCEFVPEDEDEDELENDAAEDDMPAMRWAVVPEEDLEYHIMEAHSRSILCATAAVINSFETWKHNCEDKGDDDCSKNCNRDCDGSCNGDCGNNG